MDYVAYRTERALEFRNLALTTPDAAACQALHHLADLCAESAAKIDAQARLNARRAAREPCPSGADALGSQSPRSDWNEMARSARPRDQRYLPNL
jgi:hypothetical protein